MQAKKRPKGKLRGKKKESSGAVYLGTTADFAHKKNRPKGFEWMDTFMDNMGG